jgi:hypothetical protein
MSNSMPPYRPKDHHYVVNEFLDWSNARENPEGSLILNVSCPRNRFSNSCSEKSVESFISENRSTSDIIIKQNLIASKVTVIMPSSVIPMHPSTEIIEESIQRVRGTIGMSGTALARCKILIMLDGVRGEQAARTHAYEEYKNRIIRLCAYHPDFQNCTPIIFDSHQHQANMTREVLKTIDTPYIFFVEQDTFPTGKIDWSGIIDAMGNDDINYIRLHIFHKILDEHRYLMLNNGNPITVKNISLVPTIQWSQRPHIAKTDFYRWFIKTYFPTTCRTMIEDRIHGVIMEECKRSIANWEKWGLWIYYPTDNDTIYRSGSNDGRRDDPKFGMIYE